MRSEEKVVRIGDWAEWRRDGREELTGKSSSEMLREAKAVISSRG